ncbi:MAG: diguanylate cyclase [Clostridia bacterium]|nr:diguanylate cyclase [Clostridia bacterium]
MVQEIYIIDNKDELIGNLINIFNNKNDKDYTFKSVKTADLGIALRNIPAMIIIDEDDIDIDVVELCKTIRKDENNSITPIAVVSSNMDREHRIEILKASIEYFIKKPINDEYIYYTIKNITSLMYINRRVSPLTGLPGNVQIQAEMKKRLMNKEDFAIVYVDLDNFKAYNDVYGFAAGDEIIKFTSKVLLENIHNIENSDNFVGHIGGDDFIAIVSRTNYDIFCKNMIAQFDSEVLSFYIEDDVERGYVEVANRKGIIEQFPLVSISIAVVEVDRNRFKTTLEIGEVGAQVKHKAKTILGSTYVINRRKF